MNNNIFISVGTTCNDIQESFVKAIEDRLRSENLVPNTIGRNKFTVDSPLKSINELMEECSGTIIIALERTFISTGLEKRGGSKESRIKDTRIPTPWNQIEAAMAYTKGMPLMFIVEEGLKSEGLLEKGHDWYVMWVKPEVNALNTPEFNGFLASWRKRVENYDTKNKNNVNQKSPIDPSSLTIGYIVQNLKTSHLWSVLGGLIILLTGAFSLGNYSATFLDLNKSNFGTSFSEETETKKLKTELKKRIKFISNKISKPLLVEDIRSLEAAFLGNIEYLSQWQLSDTNYYAYEDLKNKSCEEMLNDLNSKTNTYTQQIKSLQQAYRLFNKLKQEAFEKNKTRADHNSVEFNDNDKEFFQEEILPYLIID